MSICLTAADDYLDHLVKLMYLVSLRFFIINLLHFSLIYCIVDKYLEENTLILCKSFFSSNIHPLILTFINGSWESLVLQVDPTSQTWRKPILNIHWRDWCWSSNTLATCWEQPTHWIRPWCWERLTAEREGDDRGRDDWMALPTQWIWVWASSRIWWGTGKPGLLSMG